MANFIGTIEAYLPGENFVQYRSRMDHLLEANDVDDTKKARLCCTFMGPLCYDKLVSLLAPATPKEKSYKEIMDILEQHFRPINNVIAERCKFFSRNRQDGEKIEDYIVELKALANECQFGEFLMDSLRDRLVSGVNDDKIQAKLLMVKDLKWETASQMCLAEEMTRRNVKDMSAAAGGSRRLESDEGDVHRIQQRANFRQRARDSGRRKEGGRQDTSDGKFPDTTCTKCGFKHERNDCRARNTNCNLCGKRGHWAAVCWSKDPENCKIQLNTLHLSTLTESFNYTNPLFFTLRIDNTEVVFEVDSGAVCTVMGSDFLREYFPYIQLEKTDVKLSQASGDPAIVEGCFRIRDQEECEDEFISLKGMRIVEGPLNYEIVRAASRRDREILQLKDLIMRGWPEDINQVPENIKDYWRFRASLSVEDDCVYYGVRIVIPRKLDLHFRHKPR
ncbi:hypothetical protein DMENIID0001_016460 [Sergentomyia squamirostris]